MLKVVIRKMLKSRWMVLCLLIGVVIASSMLSSFPEYSGGILQKVLTKDLENFQKENNIFPGTYYFQQQVAYNSTNYYSVWNSTNRQINSYFKQLGIPLVNNVNTIECSYGKFRIENGADARTALDAMTDLQKHVKIVYGHYPSALIKDNTYEAMVSQGAMSALTLDAGKTYALTLELNNSKVTINVKIVGVFSPKNNSDSYWYKADAAFNKNIFIDYSLFTKELMKESCFCVTESHWYATFDYHKITMSNLGNLTDTLKYQQASLSRDQEKTDIPILDTLINYNSKQKQLLLLLWVLETPVILVLFFYLFMVAQLIMEEEKNEIAVLKSRGASQLQIFKSYFIESLILAGFALIFGPLIGLFISSIIGSSNGFLEFVSRTSLPIHLEPSAYIYALAAVGIFIITMLIPSFTASKISIVEFKRKNPDKKRSTLWKKCFLDLILLAVSGYGIYSYNQRNKLMSGFTGSAANLPVDPLLFLISTAFILGLGLLFIRIYPFFIRLVFKVGKRIWNPASYASLLYVSRSGGMNQFLILFLVFTVSIGIFNATAARTINSNTEEKILYSTGADITLTPSFASSAPNNSDMQSSSASSSSSSDTQIREPDFDQFLNLSGVERATKVFTTDTAYTSVITKSGQQNLLNTNDDQSGDSTIDQGSTDVRFMAVIPSDFGKIAWFRTDLLPYHWYYYLNYLTRQPNGLLLSSAFKKNGVKLGDYINIQIGDSTFSGIACGFVDYWPTCNPNKLVDGKKQPYFVIGNLNYFQTTMPMMPYQVWLQKKLGATSAQIYQDIRQKKIEISGLSDTSQQIIESKNNAVLQGINGALTLSFLMTILIAGVGFLIYWIMSIRTRVLQFGILRAMGLKFRELINMLVLEQFLISIMSVLAGVFVGTLTSVVFIPMMGIAFNTSEQVLPFEVFANSGDYIKILALMAVILAAGLAVLCILISRIHIDQAIKLGED